MDFYSKIRAFLGLPTIQDQKTVPNRENFEKNLWKDYHNETSPQSPLHNSDDHFNIFSDPLEMSRYFEQQMDEMLKSFGFGSSFTKDFHLGDNLDTFNAQLKDDNSSSEALRERFLKPGYESDSFTHNQTKEDKDMDGKVDIRDLNKVFDKSDDGKSTIIPRGTFHSFSKNIVTSTIMSSDGSIETRNTFKDNQGNEETRITRKKGDKEYTIIKRLDTDGRETVTENFINLEKDEVDKYFPSRHDDNRNGDPSNWGFFNRFF